MDGFDGQKRGGRRRGGYWDWDLGHKDRLLRAC